MAANVQNNSPPARVNGEKAAPGASWKANEQQVLPKNNIPIVFFGLMSCIFLAALDQVRHRNSCVSYTDHLPLLDTTDDRGNRTAYHC